MPWVVAPTAGSQHSVRPQKNTAFWRHFFVLFFSQGETGIQTASALTRLFSRLLWRAALCITGLDDSLDLAAHEGAHAHIGLAGLLRLAGALSG